MKRGRNGRSGATLPRGGGRSDARRSPVGEAASGSSSAADETDLFDAGNRGAGGTDRAIREHLQHLEEERAQLRGVIAELEEAVLMSRGRALERVLNPSNELPPSAAATARGGARAPRRHRALPRWVTALRDLPWPQIVLLVVVIAVVVGLFLLVISMRGQ